MVSLARLLIRVRETSDDPGSLNAMWPSGPMPPRKIRMDPKMRVPVPV